MNSTRKLNDSEGDTTALIHRGGGAPIVFGKDFVFGIPKDAIEIPNFTIRLDPEDWAKAIGSAGRSYFISPAENSYTLFPSLYHETGEVRVDLENPINIKVAGNPIGKRTALDTLLYLKRKIKPQKR